MRKIAAGLFISLDGAISVTYRPSRSGEQATARPLDFPDAAGRSNAVAESRRFGIWIGYPFRR